MLKLSLLIIFFKVINSWLIVRQKLRLEVFHEHNPPKLIGIVETSIGEVFGSPTNGMKKILTNEKKEKGG